jgi:hypothetical protein
MADRRRNRKRVVAGLQKKKSGKALSFFTEAPRPFSGRSSV